MTTTSKWIFAIFTACIIGLAAAIVVVKPFAPPGGADQDYRDTKQIVFQLGDKIVAAMGTPEMVQATGKMEATLADMAKLKQDYSDAKAAGKTDLLNDIAEKYSADVSAEDQAFAAAFASIQPLMARYQLGLVIIQSRYKANFQKDLKEFQTSMDSVKAQIKPLGSVGEVIFPIETQAGKALTERQSKGEQITPQIQSDEQLKAVTDALNDVKP